MNNFLTGKMWQIIQYETRLKYLNTSQVYEKIFIEISSKLSRDLR